MECKLIGNNPNLSRVALAAYHRHVEAKTVPTGWRKFLTVTGVEKYRHSSVMDEYESKPPIYPAWTKSRNLSRGEPPKIPEENLSTALYVAEFNKLNKFLEV